MKIQAYKEDIGQQYRNLFKENNIYPFSQIGRVVVNKDSGDIVTRLHEFNSYLDENGNPYTLKENEDIMVYYPCFYCKREWVGTEVKDSILTEMPTSTSPRDDGYEIHPIFLREDGSLRPYILVGAFLGTEKGGQLRSIPSGEKPTVSKTLEQFRTIARGSGRDNRWNLLTPDVLSMRQLLYKVAFQNLNSQQELGNGWVNKSESGILGSTMKLGNRCGYLGVNGNQISLFGEEDFYGNIWQFIDGFVVKDDGYYFSNAPSKLGTISSYEKFETTPLMGNEANSYLEGYVKGIENIGGKFKYLNIPKVVTGASNTSYYCDYFWSHKKQQENLALFGAGWGHGARAGAFCLYCLGSLATSWSDIGARIVFLP